MTNDDLVRAASDIGFPVLVKPSAAAVAKGCNSWNVKRTSSKPSLGLVVRRRQPLVTIRCSLNDSWSDRDTSKCRSWPISTAR